MYPGERNTAGQQWHGAPYQSSPATTGMIQGVWLYDDEEVEWIWTYGLDGTSYVSGYTVRKKSLQMPDKFELPDTKETQ